MDKFLIEGGQPLTGPAEVSGSKNAALPIMAAVLASDGPLELTAVPDLDDVHSLLGLLGTLGVHAEFPAENQLKLVVETTRPHVADYDLVRRMRASICVPCWPAAAAPASPCPADATSVIDQSTCT